MRRKWYVGLLCTSLLLYMTGCGGETGDDPAGDPTAYPTAYPTEGTAESFADRDDADEQMAAEPGVGRMEEPVQMPTEEPVQEPTEESAQEPAWELAVENEYYKKLIQAVGKCIAGEEAEIPEEYDFSVEIHMFPNSDTLGYCIEDIDGDGTEELLFGDNWDDTVIYNIYTISEGELIRVTDGWARNHYFLCENGMIANEGSSSAAETNYAYFTYDGLELRFVEAVIYDGYFNPENPWFYSTESEYDAEYAEPVSEERAREIMSAYSYRKLTLTPFPSPD